MREVNQIVAGALEAVGKLIAPGVTTIELDRVAEEYILSKKAKAAFKNYRGYKHTLCTSVNEEVVHGIPSARKLKEGDIVGVDCGALLKGFYGDMARTFAVGKIDNEARRLLNVTEESLYKGIEAAVVGNRLHDISAAVQRHVEAAGFSVVRDFVGHGIGTGLHEDPQIPNFGEAGTGVKLKEGMVFAIEPMVNAGDWRVKVLNDGWTVVTQDMSLSAHFEHSIAITKDGPCILGNI